MSDDELHTDASYKPKSSLREEPLKRALKCYLVSPILKKYVVCSVRCLWKENGTGYNDMLQKKEKVENCLRQVKEIALVVSCVTAMKDKDEIKCGFAFWVAFDFAESLITKMEDQIFKLIFESGVDVSEVKSIKTRGEIHSIIFGLIIL